MITILSPHMGSNALGRALVLAQLARALGYPARIVGSTRRGDAIWRPALEVAAASQIELATFPLYHSRDYLKAARALRELLARPTDQTLVISKPLPTSMGLALLAGVAPRDALLDIDDWELGFRYAEGASDYFDPVSRKLGAVWESLPFDRLNTVAGTYLADRAARWSPHRTVSNGWLQERFGGEVVPHVRDAQALDPSRHTGREVRARLAMGAERCWVGFIGTPRAHKGVDVLIEALVSATGEGEAPGLMLCGFDSADRVAAGLLERAQARLGAARVRSRGVFAFEELGDYVAAADVVAIPSLRNMASVGQIPAKLFDAMAMARAVVVTDVNDMPQIVGEAGRVVRAGDVEALSGVVSELCGSGVLRARLGEAARERLKARYSMTQGASALRVALERLWRAQRAR